MNVQVNGEAKELRERATVRELIEVMGLGSVPVAVERNHDIVPRALHASTELVDGDVLEVVHFVGGG